MSKTPDWPMLLLDPETLGFSNSVCVFVDFLWNILGRTSFLIFGIRCWKMLESLRCMTFSWIHSIAIRQNGGGKSARSVAWTKTFPSANPPRSHQSILLHELTSQLRVVSGAIGKKHNKMSQDFHRMEDFLKVFQSMITLATLIIVNNGPAQKKIYIYDTVYVSAFIIVT